MNKCACGCGETVSKNKSYIYMHYQNSRRRETTRTVCLCGCGKLAPKNHKYDFGHLGFHRRKQRNTSRTRCLCGCRKLVYCYRKYYSGHFQKLEGTNHPHWRGGLKFAQAGTKAKNYLKKNGVDVEREDIMKIFTPIKQYFYSQKLIKEALNG